MRSMSIIPDGAFPHLSVEDVFEKLGGFSWFQVWAMVVVISPEIVAAMIALSPVLTGSSDVPFHCESLSGVNFNISGKDIKTDDVCDGTLTPWGPHRSVVQEWVLVGSKAWVSDLFTSLQMMGSMLGAVVASQFAERSETFSWVKVQYGRKKAHFILCFLMGSFGFASGFAPDPYTYAITRCFAGFAVGGCFVVYVNYLMEFLTPSFRTICGCVSLWAVGEMLLAYLGYLLPNWRHLTFATSLPTFLIFLAYPWFPESPRWLLCKERTDEALAVFDKIARWNRKPCVNPLEIKILQKAISSSTSNSSLVSITDSFKVLKFKGFRTQLMILMLSWFTCQLIYYGISFNMKHLDGDPHWNVFYMGVLDLPGSFTGILLNNVLGRKKTFITFLSIASLFLLGLITADVTELSVQYPTLINGLSLASRYFIAAAFAVLSCFTAESFPTVGRVGCMGLCALVGNIGGILAPQFAFIGTVAKSTHFISFGLLSIITVLISLKLRDSTGKPLQDNFDEESKNEEIQNSIVL